MEKADKKQKRIKLCFGDVFEPERGKIYIASELYELIWNSNHPFTGKGYKCESCNKLSCIEHTKQDAWEERLADGVFLCHRCYRANQHAFY